ncbi:DUF1572 family protein [Paenibacillus sp. GCM10027626]|uniref:DUF1572 family protein n=1 Tax=Paenibacillus sp. GCM10027626 TaxID=3273411 RepID=UPI003643A7DF
MSNSSQDRNAANAPQKLDLASHVLELSLQDFMSQKKLGDKAIGQLPDDGLFFAPNSESNSIAVIINHMYGNMLSRWTDFLTTDGEKENRNRDAEFETAALDRHLLMERWDAGWNTLFFALKAIQPEDLQRTIYIRGEAHTAIQAIHRQISHYGYHVGQIVYIAKAYCASHWQTLSIPKGGSASFNKQMREQA